MPNSITHLHFGLEVKKALPQDIIKTIDRYPEAFKFGTIGPDFLFVLRELGSSQARYCNVMQYERAYEVFEAIAEYIKTIGDKCALSYAYGLMCHYVLDFNVHPYVNWAVEEGMGKFMRPIQKQSIHSLVESAMDEFYVTERKKIANSNYYAISKDLAMPKASRKSVSRLYVESINNVLGFEAKKRDIGMSILLIRLFMWATTDKRGIKRKIIDKLEDRSGGKKKITVLMRPPEGYGEIDYLNFEKRSYRKVRNLEGDIDLNAIELIDGTVSSAAEYVNKFYDAVHKNAILKKEDFIVNYEGVAEI